MQETQFCVYQPERYAEALPPAVPDVVPGSYGP
jgi:hypothetical protein